MSDFLLAGFWFFFGMTAGVSLTVYQAHRPLGFKANNGKRYKLVELNQSAALSNNGRRGDETS